MPAFFAAQRTLSRPALVRSQQRANAAAAPRTVYLAGPDVFMPNAAEIRDAQKRLCRVFGRIGLHPLDNEIPQATPDRAARIYAANIDMMRQAEIGVFNLTPFRGPSADLGTAFELGFMTALGKPVFGYSEIPSTLRERIAGVRYDAVHRVWRDPDGCVVEDFDLSDNLMVACAVANRPAPGPVKTGTSLRGLRECLELVVSAERAFGGSTRRRHGRRDEDHDACF